MKREQLLPFLFYEKSIFRNYLLLSLCEYSLSGLRVAVNTRFLIANQLEGIGRFSYEILKRMALKYHDVEFYFLFDRPFSDEFVFSKNVTPVVVSPQARHPLLWKMWFELSIPKALKKIKPDVFLSLDGFTSTRTKYKRVTVVHDLAFLEYPQFVKKNVANYYTKNTPKYINSSNKVIAVSEFTKNDIIAHYNTPESKIEVVYNACEQPLDINAKHSEAVASFLSGSNYFLYLGAIHPRKNILNILKAYEAFKLKNFRDTKLIIAGRDAWQNEDVKQFYKGMKQKRNVLFTDEVSEAEKWTLYKNAFALVYVPLWEGFGLPIIEAQSVGCPVITSNLSSMPEVAGEKCLLAYPDSPNSISDSMSELSNVPGMRDKLISGGYENVQRFSWDRSADKVMDILKSVVA